MFQDRRRTTSLLPRTSPRNNHSPTSSSVPPSRPLGFSPTPSLPNLSPSPPMPNHSPSPPPAPSSADISLSQLQSHLYTSFVDQITPDVALRITGSWHAIYNLHRVVLIQAGFFRSLFTAGFIESRLIPTPYHNAPHIVDVAFDDPNITRPAFEVCVARLYGGGPSLHISPTLIPSPSHPLTPSEPFTIPPIPFHDPPCPTNHHPASPRFLLSLLATSVYLSMPSVASHALVSVLSTIGPRTVVRYLDFALGRGIGEVDGEEPEAAVGLEKVAQPPDKENEFTDSLPMPKDHGPLSSLPTRLQDSHINIDKNNVYSASEIQVKKEDPSDTSTDLASDTLSRPAPLPLPTYYYGGISDRIGEAVGCWLARWGSDMLRYEEESQDNTTASAAASSSTARRRGSTLPKPSRASTRSGTHGVEGEEENPPSVPMIWRRGGLDAKWVRLVLSSDTLFVKGEKERYELARSIVELRRGVSLDQEEEDEWALLFDQGIYYANMGFDDLMFIMEDVSSITGRPFVSFSVLQSAHWDQSVLQHHVMFRPPGSPPSPSHTPSAARGTQLGITLSTVEIQSSLAYSQNKAHTKRSTKGKPYFPVPSDSSSRVGDSSGLDGATMDHLFALGSSRGRIATGTYFHHFGLEQRAFLGSVCPHEDPDGKLRWSPYPPLRFGVEFWDVEALKEKNRMHSHTVWYAGSLWNVYVQVVRKKGVQLGIYLHRQSSVDPIPPSSAPLPSATSSGVPLRQSFTFHAETSPVMSRSSTPHPHPSTSHSNPASPSRPSSLPNSYSTASVHATPNSPGTIPATAPPLTPTQPYRDPRPSISAYFTIACASATGSSMTRFTSSPDNFSVSQSWGWKSSSLRTEEYIESSEDGSPNAASATGREVSLRATVILGVI